MSGSVVLHVRLTPKGGRDSVDGRKRDPGPNDRAQTDLGQTDPGLTASGQAPVIQVRVRAAPERGAANKALIATVAAWLGIPKTSISLTAGQKSRRKTLTIPCPPGDTADIAARIAKLPET